MFTRVLFDTEPPMADSDHLVGAMIITFAVMAMAEVGRLCASSTSLFGLWLIAAPWLLRRRQRAGSVGRRAVGVAVIAFSLPRGTRSDEHYGRWDRLVL